MRCDYYSAQTPLEERLALAWGSSGAATESHESLKNPGLVHAGGEKMMFSRKDIMVSAQAVLVTGGTSGIGLQLSKNLLAAGHKVIVACRSQQRASDLHKEVSEKVPNNAPLDKQLQTVILDLNNLSTIRGAVQKVKELTSTLDCLVLNAGVVRADAARPSHACMHARTQHKLVDAGMLVWNARCMCVS